MNHKRNALNNWWASKIGKDNHNLIKLKSTKEYYKIIAKNYETERIRKALFGVEERHLLPLLPILKGRKVLDVGCGTGRWSRIFAKKGAEVYGIDNSKEMLETARKIKSVRFKIMDARKLYFSDNSFDFVFSSLMLSLIRDWKKALKEMIRVTKPDGYMIISDIHGAVTGGRISNTKVLEKRKVFSIREYPIFPSDILRIAKNKCQVVDIIEVRSSELQNKMRYFDSKRYHQAELLIMKLVKKE